MNQAAYYLSSLESARLRDVRECRVLFRTQFSEGKECLVVKLDPAINAQEFGVPQLDRAVLVARHERESLLPIHRFPCFVFVCRILGEDLSRLRDSVTRMDVAVIG